MSLRSFFPNLLKTLKGRSGLTKKIVDPDKTPILEGAARELADVAPTAEEVAKAEKLLNDQELSRLKITPGSLEQLMRAPHTITDPETKRWASDLYKSWDAANMRAEPYNAESILKNLEKNQAARSTSGYRGFEEGAPTTQEMRLRKLKEFAEGKAEGARDIYLPDFSNAGKKAAAIAALTGGGLAASSLMPEEAEAGAPRLLSRKEVAAAIKAATREGKPDITALFKSLGAVGTSDEHLVRGSNILDHLIFEKTGLPETKAMDAVQLAYPEFKKLKKIGETKKPDLYGRIIIPESEIGGTLRRDPLNAKLLINPELKTRIGESALLAHEAQHLRDAINAPSIGSLAHPKTIEDEIRNIQEILNASPEKKEAARQQIKQIFKRDPLKNQESLSFDDVNDLYLLGKKTGNKIIPTLLDPIEFPQVMTHRHHVEYPKNYEWEKTNELIEEGIRPVNEDELFKKMQEVSSDYRAASKKPRGSVTGLMAAAGVGAGTVAASNSAQASEGPTISQSNPEFASDVVQPESKDPLSHFEQKYGTYDIPGGIKKLVEAVDKYTGRPARAAALAALEGKNPFTGAVESVSKDEDVEGQQVARQFLENLEEKSGMRLRAPRDKNLEKLHGLGLYAPQQSVDSVDIDPDPKSLTNRMIPLIKRMRTIDESAYDSSEFPAEGALGFAADATLDPTNLAGMGLGTKVGKGFSKIRNLVK